VRKSDQTPSVASGTSVHRRDSRAGIWFRHEPGCDAGYSGWVSHSVEEKAGATLPRAGIMPAGALPIGNTRNRLRGRSAGNWFKVERKKLPVRAASHLLKLRGAIYRPPSPPPPPTLPIPPMSPPRPRSRFLSR
jgi:hypothetical protein